jgi:spectinomycin phosphotransferase
MLRAVACGLRHWRTVTIDLIDNEDRSRRRFDAAGGERLRTWVRRDFGLDLITIDATGLGADVAAQVWRGTCADGTAYAIKLSGAGSAAGLVVSAHLAHHGVRGAVGPVPTRDGRLWSERERRRLSVVPWVSDDRALNSVMDPEHWVSYGALLAEVHAIAPTDAMERFLPREDHTHERLALSVHTLDSRLRKSAAEQDPADNLVRGLAHEWCAEADLVSTLLEQADALGRKLRARPTPGVICHGDPHLGNVLLGRDRRVWLIDWDDASLAPRERDLMFVIGGVIAAAPVSPQEQSLFFDGYGVVVVDPVRLAYYRCTRALDDLTYDAVQVVDVHRYAESERAIALTKVREQFSPSGLPRLALSTLREVGLITA